MYTITFILSAWFFNPQIITVVDYPVLAQIRQCESGGNDLAQNPHSTAKGRYQFLDSTWKYYAQKLWGDHYTLKNVFNGEDSEQLARFVISHFGTSDWDASKDCWDK